MSERRTTTLGRITGTRAWTTAKQEIVSDAVTKVTQAEGAAAILEAARELRAVDRVIEEIERTASAERRRSRKLEVV